MGRTVVNKRRTMKISESVTREIVADISNLAPGTMLPPEARLLERYQVGRASLREALRVLEMQGMIVIRPGPGGGPMVAQADTEHFGRMASLFFHMAGATYRDVLETRLIVEPAVAALVAANQDPEHMKILEEFVGRTDTDGTATTGFDDTATRAVEFHAMLIDMADNPVVALLSHCVQDYSIEMDSDGVLNADEQREIDDVHTADRAHDHRRRPDEDGPAHARAHGPLPQPGRRTPPGAARRSGLLARVQPVVEPAGQCAVAAGMPSSTSNASMASVSTRSRGVR